MAIKVTKDRLKQTLALIESLGNERVLVGIPASESYRRPEPGEPPSATPINNADLGYIHEMGSPAANIPARPFLVPGVQSARERLGGLYESAARAILAGRVATASEAHARAGLIASAAVKTKITEGPFTPLAPLTLANRKRRGRTGTRPLIDTGQLRNAITYVIRKVGE